MKKYLIGIFICLFSVFLMSHNVNAITPVIDLNDYENYRYLIYPVNDCTFSGGENIFSGQDSFCRVSINGYTTINSIKTHDTYAVNKGDIVNFYLFVYTTTDNVRILPKLENISNNTLGWDLISINKVTNEDFSGESLYRGNLNQSGNNYNVNYDEYKYYVVNRVYEITLKANRDGNLNVGLTTGGGIFSMHQDNLLQQFVYSIKFLKWYRYNGSSINKEVENKTQDAANNSASAGSSSSTDATSGTSSLLSVIGAGIGAITAASPSSCIINGNMGHLDVGTIDLCATPVPDFMQVVGSIIAVLVVLPLVIILFNRFISIIRSFQT